jgi:hypothetical protein
MQLFEQKWRRYGTRSSQRWTLVEILFPVYLRVFDAGATWDFCPGVDFRC